jgi:hypothetical protein
LIVGAKGDVCSLRLFMPGMGVIPPHCTGIQEEWHCKLHRAIAMLSLSSAVFCFSRCTIPSVPQTEKPHSKVAEERKMISDVQPIGTANHMFSLPSDRFAFSLNPTDRFAVTRVDQHLPIPWYAASASQALFSRANIFWFFLCSAGLKSALSTSASFSRMPILILDTWDQTMDGYVLLLPTQVTYRETGGVAYLKMPLKFMRGWTWAHRNGP